MCREVGDVFLVKNLMTACPPASRQVSGAARRRRRLPLDVGQVRHR